MGLASASRSLQVGGSAIHEGAMAVIDRAKALVAEYKGIFLADRAESAPTASGE